MDNISTIGQRIQTIIDYYGMTMNSFSIRVGLANNSIIGKVINIEDRKPSFETIVKILNAFPDIQCKWLIMGEGEMMIPGRSNIPDPADRIAYVMKRLKLNTEHMAIKMKLNEGDLVEILAKRKAPEIRDLSNIASSFPGINPSWIILNEGEMMRPGSL